MKAIWLSLVCLAVVACGGDDSGGGGGAGTGGTGAGTGGSSGSSGGTGGASGSASGGTGGAPGSASGGAAGSSAGSGGGSNCTATTNQYANVDCKAACEHFTAWGKTGACANPYAGDPQCELACNTVKDSMPYVNALYGCAGDNADCAAWKACLALICG